MANCCYYVMCITGKPEAIDKFVTEGDVDGEYVKEGGFGDNFCVFSTVDDLVAMGYIKL